MKTNRKDSITCVVFKEMGYVLETKDNFLKDWGEGEGHRWTRSPWGPRPARGRGCFRAVCAVALAAWAILGIPGQALDCAGPAKGTRAPSAPRTSAGSSDGTERFTPQIHSQRVPGQLWGEGGDGETHLGHLIQSPGASCPTAPTATPKSSAGGGGWAKRSWVDPQGAEHTGLAPTTGAS